jgi:hypothetical protein
MIAGIRAHSSSFACGDRPPRLAGAAFSAGLDHAMPLDQAMPRVLATAFTGNRRAAAVARAAATFFGIGVLQHPAFGFGVERLLAEQPALFADLRLKRAVARGPHTSPPVAAAVNAPQAARRRRVKSWYEFTPWRWPTRLTQAPRCRPSSTIRVSSAALQRRRR